ncbi:hypothetical protein J5N58_17035 [Rhizobium cremeum]|uniref:hypothetical protein n=1 Tax=Rhizobium cremeum TaxID=2813827 RepID=UPI001FD2D93F|nr:hypothetical protein [Rhizobium cremeum]MCJ7996125.1 hypothetical protein [Rhizobium cremeum]MCJ8001384.1 hypothetical protein [Rhizobium cremeum]
MSSTRDQETVRHPIIQIAAWSLGISTVLEVFAMADPDQKIDDKKGDEILRRMLKTPPEPKKSENTAGDKNKKDSRKK